MNKKILVIDTETGGLCSEEHSLLSVAGVVLDIEDATTFELFSFFVKEPKLSINNNAMKINKIDLNDVISKGLEPKEATNEIISTTQREFGIGNRVVLAGHNVGFDVAFLKRLFRLANSSFSFEKLFEFRVIDTASIFQFLQLANVFPKDRSNLDVLLKATKVPYEDNIRHTASGDAILTAKALLKLIQTMKK